MDNPQKKVWLGILGGSIFTIGAGLTLLWTLLLLLKIHPVFVLVNIHWLAVVLPLPFALTLVTIGAIITRDALRQQVR
ncbi:hypothetical protein [Granulicella sp. dw_53]|uniref:hypothetical protein n=1 Tax=Granulicella sp. dw_53 TaxID=2719792 RepID=UPI001BD3B679|nr:hypothetical protein [Granulicella sp. dw_53]